MLYESAIFLTTIKADREGNKVPDVPFKYYGINVVRNGVDVTYKLNSLRAGDEVLCKLDYRAEPHANPDVLVEKTQAEAFAGNLGNDFETIRKDTRYLRHYNETKADRYATTTELGVRVPYTGTDAAEVTKFAEFIERGIQ
jgi:hypothetical protein